MVYDMEALFFIAILLFSVILHEIAHGYTALSLGDPTAKHAGRLTLNPIPHIDIFGSILLPAILIITSSPILFGWAKPVPVNPNNLRDRQYGSAKVSFAGPAANLAIALFFGLALRFFGSSISGISPELIGFFNQIVLLNLALALFNLMPIPPLDGSHILFDFLPRSMYRVRNFLSQYGIFILLFFIIFFSHILAVPVFSLFRFITGY
jgi:Zn-dependent protease